jgi:hypothetical protein
MSNRQFSHEHYVAKGVLNNLELLMKPDEVPPNTNEPAIWRCRITGVIFDRAYHQLPQTAGQNSSPGQRYWIQYRDEYYKTAEYYGLEFVYDPLTDFAPSDTRSPVKWRVRDGRVVVLSLHQLKYGQRLRNSVADLIGVSRDMTPYYLASTGQV